METHVSNSSGGNSYLSPKDAAALKELIREAIVKTTKYDRALGASAEKRFAEEATRAQELVATFIDVRVNGC